MTANCIRNLLTTVDLHSSPRIKVRLAYLKYPLVHTQNTCLCLFIMTGVNEGHMARTTRPHCKCSYGCSSIVLTSTWNQHLHALRPSPPAPPPPRPDTHTHILYLGKSEIYRITRYFSFFLSLSQEKNKIVGTR